MELQENIKQTSQELGQAAKSADNLGDNLQKAGVKGEKALGSVSKEAKQTNNMLTRATKSTSNLVKGLSKAGDAAHKLGGAIKNLASAGGIMALAYVVVDLVQNFDHITESLGLSNEETQKLYKGMEKVFKIVGTIFNAIKDGVSRLVKTILNPRNFKEIWDGFLTKENLQGWVDSGDKWGKATVKGWVQGVKTSLPAAVKEVSDPLDELLKKSASFVKETTLNEIRDAMKTVQDALKEETDPNRINQLNEVLEALKKERNELNGLNLEPITQANQQVTDSIIVRDQVEAEVHKSTMERLREEIEANQEKINLYQEGAAAAANLIDGIAAMYESDEESAKKNEKKIKALKIASATIDMLSGAVTAFTSAMQLGPIVGPIVGGVNAAAVIAMGVANINKIKSTTESSTSATATPPSVSYNVPQAQQQYVQNNDYNDVLNDIKDNTSRSQAVLVVDDVTKAQGSNKRIAVTSSF